MKIPRIYLILSVVSVVACSQSKDQAQAPGAQPTAQTTPATPGSPSIPAPVPAPTTGTGDSGGGDTCEQKIQFIRDSLQMWIKKGGSKTLQLPASMTVENYSSLMEQQLSKAHIRCVKPGDEGHPVQIEGTPKVCRFDRTETNSFITCNLGSFVGTGRLSLNDQFILIHHEYAGLAGLENPTGDVSSYWLSNQISSPSRPLSAKINFSGMVGQNYTYENVTIPFGPLKYVDNERFVHHKFSVSENCEIETEIVTQLNEDGSRGITVFSWLFMKDRGPNPDLAKEKQVCGPSAMSSVFTLHANFPDKSITEFQFDSDILGGAQKVVIEDNDISSKRFKFSFSED
jgi:hypothetical protein